MAKFVLDVPPAGRLASPGWLPAPRAAWGDDFSESPDGQLALELVGGESVVNTNFEYVTWLARCGQVRWTSACDVPRFTYFIPTCWLHRPHVLLRLHAAAALSRGRWGIFVYLEPSYNTVI